MSETFKIGDPVIYRGKTYSFPGHVCGITDDGQYIVRAIGAPDGSFAGMKHIYGATQLETRDETPAPQSQMVGAKPIALISEGTLRHLLQDTGGTFRISAPKWPTETETIPLYLAVPPATDQLVETSDPIAWAEIYDGKIVTVQLGRSKWHTTPLYMSAPSDHVLGWQDIATVPTDERLILIGSYNGRRQWCSEVWSTRYLRDQFAKSADGFFLNAPHLEWLPTHWAELPGPPALSVQETDG